MFSSSGPFASDVLFFCFFNDTATTEIYTSRSSAASDVYKRQVCRSVLPDGRPRTPTGGSPSSPQPGTTSRSRPPSRPCLLYTSDAADERSSVDLGGRRIIKKKTTQDEAGSVLATGIIDREHTYCYTDIDNRKNQQ